MILLLGDPEEALAHEFKARGYSVERVEESISLDDILRLNPEHIISYNYRHILKPVLLNRLQSSIINLHISYLPHNRGADPNVWSFLEDSPKGVTIHYIDSGIDTGPILAQKQIELSAEVPLSESYAVLHQEIRNLFWEIWPNIEKGSIQPRKQLGEGSVHYLKDRIRFEGGLADKGWMTSASELKRWFEVTQR